MQPIVETHNLHRRFGMNPTLQDVTFSLREGSLVGLIGTNGSGKTTLLRHVLSLFIPTSGSSETLGVLSGEMEEERLSQMGAVFQEPQLLGWMTVEQQLR